ncbi:MAG TPA: lysylphosphatidylglycerol synthase transmembrane domain-containing protein [Candidatus Limnocylindrales bacterium]|nr:lysylphosphatidylglycerol synthase transmembrane domain-containing protein [Candidatus Limnocylindrales bacterium]
MEKGAASKGECTERALGVLLSYGIGIGCLYWILHDIRFSDLVQSLRTVSWWWILPAMALDLLVYVCAAWEWQLLLSPVGHLTLGQTAKALFAGRFANDVLPVHAGYVVRIYLAARWLGSGIAAVIPSLLIERLFDGLWLAIGIGFVVLFFPLPQQLARTGEVLGGVILSGGVVVSWMVLRRKHDRGDEQPRSPMLHWKPVRQLQFLFENLENGIRSIGQSGLIVIALGLSILKLILQALAFLAVIQAYGFGFSLWVNLTVFLITYIGISLPSTPASMGVFQLFCVEGLRFFGVPKPAATACALVAYVVLTAPLAIAGFIAVAQSGLTLRQVRREVAEWRSKGRS